MSKSEHAKACNNCPWLLSAPLHFLSIEEIHNLRLELITRARTAMPCHENQQTNCATQTSQASTFPSFEALADANGAGLYAWTTGLKPGDLVVHLINNTVSDTLVVYDTIGGLIKARNASVHSFNHQGFEFGTLLASRILPATSGALSQTPTHKRLRHQEQPKT